MNTRHVFLILRKELTSALGDRRVLLSTVLIPLIVLPMITTLPMLLMGSKDKAARTRPSRIALQGVPFPELEQALRDSERFTLAAVESTARAIRENRIDAALEVGGLPDGMRSADVMVIFDAARTESRAAADKLRLTLNDLNRRILARTIDTTRFNLNPIRTQTTNVSNERAMGGFFLGAMIGMMVIVGLINGSMVMAIDSTAGEKERKTLEVLLAAPIKRDHIVLGKFLATLVTGMVSVLLMTTGYSVSLIVGLRAIGPTRSGLPMTLSVTPGAVLMVLPVMLVVAAAVAALEMAVGVFARSYREAQNYLVPLSFAAVVPVLVMQTLPPLAPAGLFLIPLLNATLLIRELTMGAIVPLHLLYALGSVLVCAVLALRLAFRMFRKESAILR